MNGAIISLCLSAILLASSASALEVSTTILEKYDSIAPGEDLQFQVYLKNIQFAGRRDVRLDYQIIKDEEIIASTSELKAIETQASFIARIRVPEETLPGTYTLQVTIDNEENASDTFTVKKERSAIDNIKYYILLLCVVILAVGFMIVKEIHSVYTSLQKKI